MESIYINSKKSISCLGTSSNEIWENYNSTKSFFNEKNACTKKVPVAILNEQNEQELQALKNSKTNLKKLDRTVLLALFCAKNLTISNSNNIGVNIGSSRGATELFEKNYSFFLEHKKVSPISSPTTTLGNISSTITSELGINGFSISHSITCSSALHGVLNACAWLNSQMANGFIVGGSEAPITEFTISQMQALGIYADSIDNASTPLKQSKKKNTMILGEGAALFYLEKKKQNNSLAKITGIGYATEHITHLASLSTNASCLENSMRKALLSANKKTVDIIIPHAPGTLLGDQAELNAINAVFKNDKPLLIPSKHKIGHTLGASGAFSLELAIEMLTRKKTIPIPYSTGFEKKINHPKTIMINAVGFGGNAVSVIVEHI